MKNNRVLILIEHKTIKEGFDFSYFRFIFLMHYFS